MLLGLQPLTTDLYLPALPLIHADLKAAAGEVQLTMSVLIFNFAIMPYPPQNELAWAASFVLVVMILAANLISRWITRVSKA